MKRKVLGSIISLLVIGYILTIENNFFVNLMILTLYISAIVTIFKRLNNRCEKENNNIIAAITHDLKNPAIAQIRAIELLLKGKFGEISDIQRTFLNDLLNSSNNMLDMLINMLWLYKYDNNKIALNISDFCIQDVLQEIFLENKLLLNSKKHIYKTVFKSPRINITADKMHIKRIITNIIMNAITHSKEGTIINIETYLENNKLIFLVKNEGKQLTEESLQCLFNKNAVFNQNSNSLSTGLGLFLSNSLLKMNNAEFIYNTDPDGINTFGFAIDIRNTKLCNIIKPLKTEKDSSNV